MTEHEVMDHILTLAHIPFLDWAVEFGYSDLGGTVDSRGRETVPPSSLIVRVRKTPGNAVLADLVVRVGSKDTHLITLEPSALRSTAASLWAAAEEMENLRGV